MDKHVSKAGGQCERDIAAGDIYMFVLSFAAVFFHNLIFRLKCIDFGSHYKVGKWQQRMKQILMST